MDEQNPDTIRMHHMMESSRALIEHLRGKNRQDLDSNRMVLSAVIRELEVVGEAANAVSDEIKNKYPEIPWKQIIGMRNRLIHAYFDVDHDILWATATQEIPKLITRLANVLP